jgi:hypothetical protein
LLRELRDHCRGITGNNRGCFSAHGDDWRESLAAIEALKKEARRSLPVTETAKVSKEITTNNREC